MAQFLAVEDGDQTPSLSTSSDRLLDVSVALIALIALAPLMLLTALVIFAQGDGPVLFAHQRIGRGGQLFRVLKFRTMAADGTRILENHMASCPKARHEWETTYKLRLDPRVTPLGRFLRASSLDELPQLFNVLRGEMSIVGPRPIVVDEIRKYGQHFGAYCSVRPGITGVWQVSGRNNISYERRVELDEAYARQKSLWFDVKVMAATIPAVLLRKGAC